MSKTPSFKAVNKPHATEPDSKAVTSSGRSFDNLETANRREREQASAEQGDQNPSKDSSNPPSYTRRAVDESNRTNVKQDYMINEDGTMVNGKRYNAGQIISLTQSEYDTYFSGEQSKGATLNAPNKAPVGQSR